MVSAAITSTPQYRMVQLSSPQTTALTSAASSRPAPAGMVSDKWWRTHRLDGSPWEAAGRHYATSLLVAYESFGDEVSVEEEAKDLVTSIRSTGEQGACVVPVPGPTPRVS